MTDEYEDIEGGEAVIRAQANAAKADGEGRRIDVRLVAWGDTAKDAEGYTETVARGAFAGTDPSRVILESTRHDGAIAGVAESIIEREDGAYATFRVASTPAGDELLTLTREGILGDASIVAAPLRSRKLKSGVIERQAFDLRRVAILPRGGYQTAKVLAVRAEADKETPTVTDDTALIERMASLEGEVARAMAQMAAPAVIRRDALAEYPLLSDYAKAAWNGGKPGGAPGDLIARTLADQITSQNDGIAQTGWITDVKRIVSFGRRAINAFGGPGPLPDHGMTVTYPYLTSSNTLIAAQATQKSEIQSARVDIDDGTATVATYAGGSDISLQLLERGTPSYLEAYQRIMLNAWASVTDNAFVTALEAGSQTQLMGNTLGTGMALATSAYADDIFDTTPDHGFAVGDAVVFTTLTGGDATTAALVNRVVWVVATSLAAKTFRVALTPGGSPVAWGTADISAGSVSKLNSTATSLRQSLFQASIQVETATGQPASVVLVGTDLFTALAGLTDVVPNYDGNPSNASGVGSAGSLRLNISNLEIIHKSAVTAGKMIVSNPIAARWLEDGPRWITADDVAKLGKDYAVYSYGAPAVFVPAGVVEVTFA